MNKNPMWIDALREYEDRELDHWFELPDHPDRFTMGLTRECAEADGLTGGNYAGWTLDKIREQYGPELTLISGFAMPGDTVKVGGYGRMATYVGMERIWPPGGQRVRWDGAHGDSTISETTEIEVIKRATGAEVVELAKARSSWVGGEPPEAGDRVRVETPNGNSFEGTWVEEHAPAKVSVVEDDCILTLTNQHDVTVQVLERAHPSPFGPGDFVHIKGSESDNLYEVTKPRKLSEQWWVLTEDGSTLPADVLELESTQADREAE